MNPIHNTKRRRLQQQKMAPTCALVFLFLLTSCTSAVASDVVVPPLVSSSSPLFHNSTTSSLQLLARQLDLGDFSALNAVFEGAIIDIPGEFQTDASDFLITRTLYINDIQCSNLRIGDMVVEASSTQDITGSPPPNGLPIISNLKLGVTGLEFDCTANYLLDKLIDDVRGSIEIKSRGSNVWTDFALESSTQQVEVKASTTGCSATVHIEDLDFSRDSFLGSILDFIEPLIRGPVKGALQDTVCKEIKSIGSEALPEVLHQLTQGLEPYLKPLDPIVLNPLQPEQQLQQSRMASATNTKNPYINFQETDSDHDASDLAHFVLDGLDQLDAWLGNTVKDPQSQTNDLAVNLLLQEMMLDDTGAFVWDMKESLLKNIATNPQASNKNLQSSTVEGMTLLESHDDLLQMVVTLDRISIRGLDSMTHFDTLQRIGNHTLQNKLGWKYLSGTADIAIHITPSSLDSSLWAQTKPGTEVVETVQLELQADDIQALSLFAAIHQDRMGQVPLGALFQSDAIANCLMSTLYASELVSGFSVQVSNLVDPTLDGFTSPGLDRILTEVMDLLYNLYEHWLIEGLPSFAQTTIRDTVNELWKSALEDLATQEAACPLLDLTVPEGQVSYVDFRDLLLSPEAAQGMGGSGKEPYGDVVSSLFGLLNDQLLAVDEGDPNKRLILNRLLLDPLTEEQSGVAGTVRIATPLLTFEVDNRLDRDTSSIMEEIAASLFDYMALEVSNATIRNINTVVEPTTVLKPIRESPHVVRNQLNMGPIDGKPLNASVQVRLTVDPFDEVVVQRRLQEEETNDNAVVEHTMELSVSAASLKVAADVLAMVDANKLQNFHLQDVFNLDCWLATIPAPALNPQGQVVAQAGGIQLDDFLANLADLGMNIKCVNEECEKAGLGVLTELGQIWEQSNVTTTIGDRFETLAAELLTGDYVYNQVARWLDKAPTQCPHNEKYNSRPTVYPPLPLPLFSPLSIDTMIFTALTGAQAGLLLMSEVDPGMLGLSSLPSGLPTMEAKNDGYVDFTSRSGIGSLGEVISYLFGQASQLLGVTSEPGQTTGINAIVRDLLNEAGLLKLQFDGESLFEGGSNLQLRLNSVWVGGLDTFTQFEVLEAVGPHVLQNNLKLERLSAEIDMSLVSGKNSQRIILSFGAEDVTASLPVYAAINSTTLEALQLGSLLDISKMLSCVFTAVEEMSIPSVDLRIGRVTSIAVQGLEPSTNEAFSQSMSMIQKMFNIGIDGLLNPVLSGVLNGVISSWSKNAVCENVITSAARRRTQEATSFIDFRDLFLSEQESLQYGGSGQSPYGDLFRTVLGFVDDLILDVDEETGLAAVNEMLIAPLTKAVSNQSGSVIMPGALVDVKNRVSVGGLNALFTFRASQARIDNLDTLRDPIALLAPVKNEPYLLNNTAQMGLPEVRPLRASVRILLGLEDDDDLDLRNDLELTMDMQAVSVLLTAFLKVVEEEFAKFPLGDILNVDCWLAKMPASPLDEYGFRQAGSEPSASVSELMASVRQLSLRTKCYSCTSEGLEDWNTEGSKDIEAATDTVVDYVTSVLGGKFLQVQIDRALDHAARRCPHSDRYDPNFSEPTYATFESEHDDSSTTFLLMLLIVTAVLIVVLALITLCVRCFVRVRHRRLLKSLPDRQLYLLQMEQEKEDKRKRELNAVTTSLFQSSATIPAFVRYVIPLVILGNIGFFLSGHLSLGATVNIEVQLAGQSLRIEEFFSFSMARSTIDIWNAGGRALAALIFIFSGLWPYTKQIITLVLWFMPPARCSMATRESILLWLDTLAKWSMVDIFVLLVSIAGFRVSIVSPDLDFLPDDFYSIDLLVVPVWGLYANMIAQIISQISSHFIIHYHRKVVAHSKRARRAVFRKTAGFLQQDEENSAEGFVDERGASSTTTSSDSEDTEDAVRRDRLCDHAFVRPHSNNSKLIARGYVSPLLILVALALSALLLAGCILPSFSLEVLGILGVFVESGNGWNQAVEKHSVFTITEMLMDQARFIGGAGDYLGLGTLSALLVLTVLIIPLVLSITLLYHWFVPMNQQKRRRMEVLMEGLQAWQYVEVYLIAMVVASWQLGPISEFMINSYCGSLDDTFDMLVYYGILDARDAQCFKVEASIESAAYMLAASAILLAFLNTYISNASRQYFRDSENKSKKGTQPSVADETSINQEDNISAVSGPGQSSVAPLALEFDGIADKSSVAGSSREETQPLAVAEYNGDEFRDEGQDEAIFANAKPVPNDPSDSDQEGEAYVDPLAQPVTSGDEVEENWRRNDAMEKIHPVPVLFTDKFRWTLQSQEGAPLPDPTPVKDDPYLVIDTDRTSSSQSLRESQSLARGESQPLLFSGDAPDSIPPTPAQSTLDGESERPEIVVEDFTESDEKDGDEADTYFTDEVAKVQSSEDEWESDNDTFTDEVIKIQSLEEWETESEDGHDMQSRGETVDLSVSTGMDQSSNSRLSDSVLLGSGNVLLQPTASLAGEEFEDELQSNNDAASVQTEDSDVLQQSTRVLQASLREAEDSWRQGYSTAHNTDTLSGTHSGSTQPLSNTRPQGNRQLQAAFLEDVKL